MAALATLAIVAFASTNLDDLFVLLALFSDPTQRPRDVVAGQFLGMAILTLVALACALAASSVPGPYVGLLGFLPLLVGLGRLRFRRGERKPDAFGPKARSVDNVFVAAVITAANGGDNIAVYVPVLVGKTWPETAFVVVLFFLLTAVWCAVAQVIISRPRVAIALKRLGSECLPWLLIALGLYILLASRTYTLLCR